MDFTARITQKATNLSNRELAEAVTAAGYRISKEGVRQWRSGISKPGNLAAVTALEEALGIRDGSLRDALGWRAPVAIEDRIAALEREVEAIKDHVGLRDDTASLVADLGAVIGEEPIDDDPGAASNSGV